MRRLEMVEGGFWDRVLDMFAQSIIIQSLITMALVFTLCGMWIYGVLNGVSLDTAIPPTLIQITMLILGFWFGQKTQVSGVSQAGEIATKISAAIIEGTKSQP